MRPRAFRSSLRKMLRFGIGGDGFLDRIRALSFAMLGLTAAAALGLVAFIANQGWPQVGSLLPVPAVHRAELSENSIVALPARGRQPTGGVPAAAAATPAPVLAGAGSGNRQASSHGSPRDSDAAPASNVVVLVPQGPQSTPSSPGTGSTTPSQPAPAPAPPEAPETTPEAIPTTTQPPVTTPTTPVPTPPSTPTTTPTDPATGLPTPDEPAPEEPAPEEPTPGKPSEEGGTEGEPEGGEDEPSVPSEPSLPPESEPTPEYPLPDEPEADPVWPLPGDWGGFGGIDHHHDG
jgi:hypothetical protein